MMTNLEQALTYIHRELKFMATDPSGASNRHKFADKVIEDVTDIPNLCSAALASSRPLAPILNAVRGPRGNALMKFFNVSLHDTRMEMTMVVAEATRLKGLRNRKTEDAYDYLSSMYQAAVRKARKLVLGRSDGKESYLDQFTNLQKFAGFGGAGLVDYGDYDDEDDDGEEYGLYMGDSAYAGDALEALRNGNAPPPPPRPQSGWGMSNLTGNQDLLSQISAIEARMGRRMTDSEIDSFITGEKMVPPIPSGSGIDEQFFADLHNAQRSVPELTQDQAKKALIAMIMSGALNLSDVQSLINGQNNQPPTDPPDAPQSVTVDPAEVAQKAAKPERQYDPELAALIRARNNLPPVTPQPPVSSDDPKEGDGDTSSNQQGSDEESGPTDDSPPTQFEGTPPEEQPSVDPPPEESSPEPSAQQVAMSGLIGMIGSLDHTILRNSLANVFHHSGTELKDIFVTIAASNEPDEVLTLLVYVKVEHSPEIVNTMAANAAVVGHSNKIAQMLDLSPSQIGKALFLVEGDSLFDDDLKLIYGSKQMFWKEGIQRNLECTAILSYFFYKYADLNLLASYVSDYPISSGQETLSYIFTLYPKTEDTTFDDIRAAFSLFPKSVWSTFIEYFKSTENVPLCNDVLKEFSVAIRIPEDLDSEKYLEDSEDLQVQIIRGNNIAAIPGLQALAAMTMERLKDSLTKDPVEPIEIEDITLENSPSLSKTVLWQEYVLKVYPKTKVSEERRKEIDRELGFLDVASASGEIAMLASASRVKFEIYAQFMEPRETADEDPAASAVEDFMKGLPGGEEPAEQQGDSVPESDSSGENDSKTNAFGLA